MLIETVEFFLSSIPQAEKTGTKLARALHDMVMNGGEGTRNLADVLHGTWLGHPLHPVLTDIVVGAWSVGALFDFISIAQDSERAEIVADTLTTVGNVAALPTMLSGMADYSTIPKSASSAGFTHAMLNATGFALQLASANARKNGERDRAIALSTTAVILMNVSAWLGGHLVYDEKVGVNHSGKVSEPREWTAVVDIESLDEQQPQRVEVAGHPVLLFRKGSRIMAIGAVCPHAGGPLEEGQFFDDCVQCPWHDSVFNLRDGTVVHGPSTYPVPSYETRIRDGQVEVRLVRLEERMHPQHHNGHGHEHGHPDHRTYGQRQTQRSSEMAGSRSA